MLRTLFEDEHLWFRESVRDFVQRTILPARERHRTERAIDRDVWLAAGSHGFLGLGVSQDYGGSGVDDFRFNAVLGEELARAGGAIALGHPVGDDGRADRHHADQRSQGTRQGDRLGDDVRRRRTGHGDDPGTPPMSAASAASAETSRQP
jgi:alkylation response protein AidB-like acyl-CoA dehydrogenase